MLLREDSIWIMNLKLQQGFLAQVLMYLYVDKHGKNSPWTFDKLQALSKNRKVDPKLIKRTYLDEIEIEQKNRKKPGICTYSL